MNVSLITKERKITGKDLERNGRDILEVILRHFPGASDENHERFPSPYPISLPTTEHVTNRFRRNILPPSSGQRDKPNNKGLRAQ
jgi:hypothetical protein